MGHENFGAGRVSASASRMAGIARHGRSKCKKPTWALSSGRSLSWILTACNHNVLKISSSHIAPDKLRRNIGLPGPGKAHDETDALFVWTCLADKLWLKVLLANLV